MVVAMSGGLDSTMTACLLKEQGYDVSGMIMKLWDDKTDTPRQRKMEQAIADATRMASLLDIPLQVMDFHQAFYDIVIRYFITAYETATTPNPCPLCNHRVKFGLLLAEAEKHGARYLATGHYARITESSDSYLLQKGVDDQKDQSYFLYQLNQQQLSRLLFPLGTLKKEDVRKMAAERSLPVNDKPESQDLCFIEDGDYRSFLAAHASEPFKEGPIVDCRGKPLGRHDGLPFYTIGQRRGVGVSAGKPLYVIGMKPDDNTLIVGDRSQRIRHELTAGSVNFISGITPGAAMPVMLKIRSAAAPVDAILRPLDNGRVHLGSEAALMDVAPGQSAVFYQGETLIGGGTIES